MFFFICLYISSFHIFYHLRRSSPAWRIWWHQWDHWWTQVREIFSDTLSILNLEGSQCATIDYCKGVFGKRRLISRETGWWSSPNTGIISTRTGLFIELLSGDFMPKHGVYCIFNAEVIDWFRFSRESKFLVLLKHRKFPGQRKSWGQKGQRQPLIFLVLPHAQ